MSIQMGRPILDLIAERVPATLLLALAATLVAVLIAIPAGIIAAIKRHTSYEYLFMTSALLGISIPHFWLGILLILLFSVFLNVLPSSGYQALFSDPLGSLEHLILPSITLGTGMVAIVARMTRSAMLESVSAALRYARILKGLAPLISRRSEISSKMRAMSWLSILDMLGGHPNPPRPAVRPNRSWYR